jgi:hypothetical protein
MLPPIQQSLGIHNVFIENVTSIFLVILIIGIGIHEGCVVSFFCGGIMDIEHYLVR